MENGSTNNQSNNQNNQSNNNRLFLNFNNNDRFSPTDRAYPTTPSTFPQPVFQAQGQNQQGQTSSQQQQQFSNGYPAAQGYFMNNPYPASNTPQTAQYQPAQQGYSQQAYQPRAAPGNDATNGLAHQFSHQNLGGAARGNPYGARQPSPSQRPRTAGATGFQQGYHGYMAPSTPALPPQPEFEPAPERNPDKYGPLTHNNQKRCAQLASDFFKDSVKRARDRNLRWDLTLRANL
jgi:protein-serine/threonine kinase